MFKLSRLHFRYFCSKNNIIVFSLIIFIYFLLGLYKSKFYINVNEQVLYKDYYQSEYDYLMFVVFKIIMILFSCYMNSLIKSNNYIVLVRSTKFNFYLTKTLNNTFILFLLSFVMFSIYVLLGFITKWFSFDKQILIKYICVLFQAVSFGLISNNMCYLLKTNLTFIFVFFIFIILENVINSSLICQLINAFIPMQLNDNIDIIFVNLTNILYFITGFCLFKRYEIY